VRKFFDGALVNTKASLLMQDGDDTTRNAAQATDVLAKEQLD